MIQIDTDKVKVGDSITVGGEYRLIFSAIKKVDACGRKVLYLKTERLNINEGSLYLLPKPHPPEGFLKKLFNFFKNDGK